MRHPGRGTPYLLPCALSHRSVMSLSPPSGACSRPRKVKLRQYDRPAFHGGEPKTSVCPTGSSGTLSLRATRRPPLIIVSAPTGFRRYGGRREGTRREGRPIFSLALFSFW